MKVLKVVRPPKAPEEKKQAPQTITSPAQPTRTLGELTQQRTQAEIPMVRPPSPQPSPSVMTSFPPLQEPEYDDNIRIRDPRTGQPLPSALDTIDLPPMNDWMRAVYQALYFGAETCKNLARMTPAVAALGSQYAVALDTIATISYQITNTSAEVARALYNWDFSRVILNQQIEKFVHPEESSLFDKLYAEWYMTFIVPVESGQAEYNEKALKEWVTSQKEIEDPRGFVELAAKRLTMERIAAQSAWMPTDMLKTTRPIERRQKTTTDLYRVFKKTSG